MDLYLTFGSGQHQIIFIMPFTIVVFVTRKPGISPAAFKNHWEHKHIPLLKSLSGPLFPVSHTRHYIARDENGDETPARVLVGEPDDFTYDGFAVVEFEDEAACKKFVPVMSSQEVEDDEEKFTDRAKLKCVCLGEVNVARRD